MKKGGYQILDLKGVELLEIEDAIEGAYKTLQNAHGKPILVSGIVIDGEKKNDVFVTPVYNSEDEEWDFELYGLDIRVLDDSGIRTQSKIIELENSLQIDSTEIVENELYLGVVDLGALIDVNTTTKVKAIYDTDNDEWLRVISTNLTQIKVIADYTIGDITKIELF